MWYPKQYSRNRFSTANCYLQRLWNWKRFYFSLIYNSVFNKPLSLLDVPHHLFKTACGLFPCLSVEFLCHGLTFPHTPLCNSSTLLSHTYEHTHISLIYRMWLAGNFITSALSSVWVLAPSAVQLSKTCGATGANPDPLDQSPGLFSLPSIRGNELTSWCIRDNVCECVCVTGVWMRVFRVLKVSVIRNIWERYIHMHTRAYTHTHTLSVANLQTLAQFNTINSMYVNVCEERTPWRFMSKEE